MDTITVFVLIIVFIVLVVISFFISLEAFKQLRKQNVIVLEAIFLAFIYSVTFLLCRGQDYRSEMQITRENLWKQFWLLLLLVIGFLFITFPLFSVLKF